MYVAASSLSVRQCHSTLSGSHVASIGADPEVIVELIRRAPDTDAVGHIGAGALEDLMNEHGREFESRILDRAACDPRFRVALAGVWSQDGVPDTLVQAIDALRKGSDQKPR